MTHECPDGTGVSGRVYVRMFDWDEARRLRAEGLSCRAIAARLGVTTSAVYRVVTPGQIEAQAANARRYASTGVCDDCGGPMNRVSRSHGSRRCAECAAVARTTSARPEALRCVTCREWKPDSDFPLGGRKIGRRGRHLQCRGCQTIARRAYRDRHKQPCVGCGKPALPPREKGPRGSGVARCLDCYHAHRRTVPA